MWLTVPWGGNILFFTYVAYVLAVFTDTIIKSQNIGVAFLTIPCVLVQMTGYGSGFLREFFSTGK
jgi:hypothetical protein